MAYFVEHYPDVRLPLPGEAPGEGLRNAQLGAVHAVASHFTLHSDPAIVVMPTGSGKTTVLMLTPFMLRAERVLLVTPSVLVRDQITDDFRKLASLVRVGAVEDGLAAPLVERVDHRVSTIDAWEELRSADVVVGTPYVLSPALAAIPDPPTDLFDVLLVDEAHHSPAKTWRGLLEHFPAAKTVLFTATPFRRDRREIKGRFAYTYPLRRAHEDNIFGGIRYVPVEVEDGDDHDSAVARRTEQVWADDQAAGLDHSVMVRTEGKRRASELMEVYREHTSLRLSVVHSGYSYRHVKRVLRRLSDRELDGIICVSMLGEGFDFPQLKIAAIHYPHRSLAATLQFIGRFARTGGENLGEAKFIAVPNDIEVERERLYREDAVWQEIVEDLSESRIEVEEKVRTGLGTFESITGPAPDLEELPLYTLRPYCHVKIYEVNGEVDLEATLALPPGFDVVHRAVSDDLSATVLVTREAKQPRWTELDVFERSEYDLFVIHHNADAGLLFICASRRTVAMYELIASQVCRGGHRILPLYRINRVIRGIRNLDCFSIGMRNRVVSSAVETYRIIAGSQAQRAVSQSDGRLFHRGHLYARGELDGHITTVGYSSSSKVWSNQNLQIPLLVDWCEQLAEHIKTEGAVDTGSGLDVLEVGRPLDEIHSPPIAATWDDDTFAHRPKLRYIAADGTRKICELLDCDLLVDQSSWTKVSVAMTLRLPHAVWPFTCSWTSGRLFEKLHDGQPDVCLTKKDESVDLLQYLNNYPPSIHLADLTRCRGAEQFTWAEGFDAFDQDSIRALDWAGVDIQREEQEGDDSVASIHDSVRQWVLAQGPDVLFYDHRSGEIADFVGIHEEDDAVVVSLYHCKSSAQPKPGRRVNDLYELCGQAIKSSRWFGRGDLLAKEIRRRYQTGSSFVTGDMQTVDRLLREDLSKRPVRRVCLVQPGISAAQLEEKTLSLLGSVDGFVRRAGGERLSLIASP